MNSSYIIYLTEHFYHLTENNTLLPKFLPITEEENDTRDRTSKTKYILVKSTYTMHIDLIIIVPYPCICHI